MAKFTSRYPALAFVVDGQRKQFSHGEFNTEDPQVIEALAGIGDAVRTDEPEEQPEEQTEDKPQRKPRSTKTSAE